MLVVWPIKWRECVVRKWELSVGLWKFQDLMWRPFDLKLFSWQTCGSFYLWTFCHSFHNVSDITWQEGIKCQRLIFHSKRFQIVFSIQWINNTVFWLLYRTFFRGNFVANRVTITLNVDRMNYRMSESHFVAKKQQLKEAHFWIMGLTVSNLRVHA